MKRVLIAAALGGLLLVGTPTLASSAQRNDTKAAEKGDNKGGDNKGGDKGHRGDDKGGDRGDKGDRGDRGHRGDRDDRGDRDRSRHGHYRDGYWYGGGYGYGYGEPYECWYGRSGAYNCEPYGGDYYGGYDGGRYGYGGYGRNRNVTVSQMRFNPPEVHAYPGQEVLWVFRDGNVPHTVTADNGSFNSGEIKEGEFRLVFEKPGSYSYHCALHPEMKGRVLVG